MMIGYSGAGFTFNHITDEQAKNNLFLLHTHPEKMEILLFFDGDADFHIEGNVYPLEPMDIAIVQSNELHQVVHRSDSRYERIVINVDNEFFTNNDCTHLENIFINRRLGEGNLFKRGTSENKLLHECFERLKKYSFCENPDPIIVKNTLMEFMYILNQRKIVHSKGNAHTNMRRIVVFINDHIRENLDLEKVASQFFMSKYHLCHLFKKSTGFTVNQYITHKRLALVKDLCAQGKTLTFAASEAGFKSYSSFYRAYMKETGKSPHAK